MTTGCKMWSGGEIDLSGSGEEWRLERLVMREV